MLLLRKRAASHIHQPVGSFQPPGSQGPRKHVLPCLRAPSCATHVQPLAQQPLGKGLNVQPFQDKPHDESRTHSALR